ncbi:hypothetical protein [Methylocystis sp. Sn-Cys]|uniref:hypothetical protein n=1 Tax=Methylocystis sp. Sn-Cys TaxID=1701263 RepID=UPI001923D7EC|nr:hypothetical protein [Methylocystis sp. Sn-Cys]MBL1256834.1 hypothetical protein [Methylocystis sp. Sn-Cys]
MDESYSIRELSEAEFEPLFDKHKFSMFAGVHSYDIQHVLTDAEQQRIKELEENLGAPYKLYLGVFDIDNEFVGWSWGSRKMRPPSIWSVPPFLKDIGAKEFIAP